MKKDMHVHSKYSRDSSTEVRDILKTVRNKGLDGVAVTDHNTIKGGLEALSLAKDFDVEVTVGAEIMTEYGEVLGYHLTNEIESRTFEEVIDEIKRQGGIIAIPHPFDALRASSIDSQKVLRDLKDSIDYIEINARSLPYFNNKARKFAEEEKINLIGGSDAHFPWEIGGAYTIWDDGTKAVGNGSIKALYPMIRTKIYKIIRI